MEFFRKLKKIFYFFNKSNQNFIDKFNVIVKKINLLENQVKKLKDFELIKKTKEFKYRIKNGESLDNILPEAFSVVREASIRALSMRHFDVQLLGGIVLHKGMISEMATGEGKTLVSTLSAYLNSLSGNSVHIITVNDYLAKRDSEWMAPIYNMLGVKVGVIYSDMPIEDRKNAYLCDITYGTNSEFGFDYLRDNMCSDICEKVQSKLDYAIIDEVDSILIDEARTPLIISEASDDSPNIYNIMNRIAIKILNDNNFYISDEKDKQVYLTDIGHKFFEKLVIVNKLISEKETLYDPKNIKLIHYITSSLKAHLFFKNNIDYIVKDNSVVIIDEHTGRTMQGRRWSDGLHQAIESKENVKIQSDSKILASITIQNYFRTYRKISGMTGTAKTEEEEFADIYGLEVVSVPTNMPMIRKDMNDRVYLTKKNKLKAIVNEIKDINQTGRPILVGTISIENSEILSKMLKLENIQHNVLNAKFHEKEAIIISQAGKLNAVTIATNMAGRGTDIILGGNFFDENHSFNKKIENKWIENNKKVIDLGGLYVIGSERHESRRIDNQLRGRSGRQGDPGMSRFYVSLEDDLMRLFGSNKAFGLMKKIGMNDEDAIENSLISKSIENAQKKVEAYNFDVRKQLLEFDDISNEQRTIIYNQRNEILNLNDINSSLIKMFELVIDNFLAKYPLNRVDECKKNFDIILKILKEEFDFNLSNNNSINDKYVKNEIFNDEFIKEFKKEFIDDFYLKIKFLDFYRVNKFCKLLVLQVLDNYWREHISSMENLRQSSGLYSYAQKNPIHEYKKGSFILFFEMLNNVRFDVVRILSNIRKMSFEVDNAKLDHSEVSNKNTLKKNNENLIGNNNKIGRNTLCYCGSGKKFKQCHGK